ncbi:VOC family protein [Verminephrobacter eiseniae]|nr:VOC family protein [Verminephrobacter eiseniae]
MRKRSAEETRRQTMRKHLQGVDHAVIAVTDLDRAQADFEHLGFTLTPRGRHTKGSENHCAMFPGDYFELLAVPVDHPATRYYSDFLRQGDGLAAVALKTDDAAAFHAEMNAAGIGCEAPVDFSRPVVLPEGARDAAFRIAQVDVAETPGGRLFVCQHFTRDVVWRPQYLSHANGAIGLQSISIASDQTRFAAVCGAYERFFDLTGQRCANLPACLMATGNTNTPIRILAPPALAATYPCARAPSRRLPCFAALHFRVTAIGPTQQFFDQTGIAYTVQPDGSLAVDSPVSHGLIIVFTPRSRD